jgi:hypothetical protein
MSLPLVMDVDTGRTESVSAETAIRIRAGATIRVTGEKVAAGQVSQGFGVEQTVAGHKVEHDQAPPHAAQWSPRRRRRVSIARNEWEFSTLEFGLTTAF